MFYHQTSLVKPFNRYNSEAINPLSFSVIMTDGISLNMIQIGWVSAAFTSSTRPRSSTISGGSSGGLSGGSRGDSTEAGKAVIRQLAATARAQFEQMQDLSER